MASTLSAREKRLKCEPQQKIVFSDNGITKVCSDAPGFVMASKLYKDTFMCEFEFHWVPYLDVFVSHLCKNLSKLLNYKLQYT